MLMREKIKGEGKQHGKHGDITNENMGGVG